MRDGCTLQCNAANRCFGGDLVIPLCRSSRALSVSMGTLVDSHFPVSPGIFSWVKSGLWLGQICYLDQRNFFFFTMWKSFRFFSTYSSRIINYWVVIHICYQGYIHTLSLKGPNQVFFLINSVSTKLIKLYLFKSDLINLNVWFKILSFLWDIWTAMHSHHNLKNLTSLQLCKGRRDT